MSHPIVSTSTQADLLAIPGIPVVYRLRQKSSSCYEATTAFRTSLRSAKGQRQPTPTGSSVAYEKSPS
jgi:hypothetical protein